MNDLLNKKCAPCESGILLFEIHKYQKKVGGWDVSENEKISNKIYGIILDKLN